MGVAEVGDILPELGKILGLAGVTVGVFYLLYNRIVGLPIFNNVGRGGTIFIIVLMMILVFSLAVLVVVGQSDLIAIFGDGNTVSDGISTGARS